MVAEAEARIGSAGESDASRVALANLAAAAGMGDVLPLEPP